MGNQALRALELLTILRSENISLGLFKEIGALDLGIIIVF